MKDLKLKIRLKNAEELLQLLNRATTLSNELEETLQCINSLNCDCETSNDELLDTSEGSVTDCSLKLIASKLLMVTVNDLSRSDLAFVIASNELKKEVNEQFKC